MNSALPRTRQQLDDKAKEVYFKANIEGKNNNIKEIDDAINFYTERQEEEDADQMQDPGHHRRPDEEEAHF